MVQWLRLHAPNAGGTSSIPGQGTKIPHATQLSQKKKKILNTYLAYQFRLANMDNAYDGKPKG